MLVSWLLGVLGMLVYASFLEWFVHKYGMHTNRISRWAFDRHAIQHHSTRRTFKAFYIPPEERAAYDITESSAVPLLWLVHVPLYVLIGMYGNVPAGVGAAMGGAAYILAYELLHFYIHAPKNHRFQRTRLFRFYCEYHRLHHHKARRNYNIVMPLADLVLGTLSLEHIEPEPSAPQGVQRDTGPGSVFRKRRVG
jgi:sterol desaturase/sphingolipid hydroxylase (fatty acid hydroxylase superfamily)